LQVVSVARQRVPHLSYEASAHIAHSFGWYRDAKCIDGHAGPGGAANFKELRHQIDGIVADRSCCFVGEERT